MFTPNRSIRIVSVLLLSIILLTACGTRATPAPTATPSLEQQLIGSWTTTVTKEDLLRVEPDFRQDLLCENAGTYVTKYNSDGTVIIDQTPLSGCPTPAITHVEDTWSLDGNVVTYHKGNPPIDMYELAIEGDLLIIKVKIAECINCRAVATANPWKRVE